MPDTNRGGLDERSRDKERLRRSLRLNILFIEMKGLKGKLRRVFCLPRSSILKVLAILQNGEYRGGKETSKCAHTGCMGMYVCMYGQRGAATTAGGVKIETLTRQLRAVCWLCQLYYFTGWRRGVLEHFNSS